MSLVKKVKGVIYAPNRIGFIQAVSRNESGSDLRYSYGYKGKNKERLTVDNPKAVSVLNEFKYVGLFQFSEEALQDVGCYRFDGTKNGTYQDWGGKGNYWTKLFGATSLSVFRGDGRIQMKAIEKWINLLCGYARNKNLNEFYGMKITKAEGYSAFEVTESGVIAAIHLKGSGAVKKFLLSDGEKNGADANNTSIAEYMSLFAHYDLFSENDAKCCCKRKIYIHIVDEYKKAVVNKNVIIKSSFKGKFNVGEIVVTHKTNEEGWLPVIVRHPGEKIQLEIDGTLVETIIQEKNKIQRYQILSLAKNKFSSSLEVHKKSETNDEKNPSNDEVDTNEESTTQANNDNSTTPITEATFNIQLVEADTGKPLPDTTYYLKYKKREPRLHKTDSSGIESDITASVSETIDIFLDNDGGTKQKIDNLSFPVTESLHGQTQVLKIPVHSFELNFVDRGNQIAPNHPFEVQYRGRQAIRKSNAQGTYKLTALVGQSITIIDDTSGFRSTNVVTDGEGPWEITVNEEIILESLIDDSPTVDDNISEPESPEPENELEVSKPNITKHDVITEDGPNHVVKSKQPPEETTFFIKLTDKNGKPLSCVSYITESIYGTHSHITGSDGTRGRPHKSAIDVTITVFVLEDGKKVKKDSFDVVDKDGKVYEYVTEKPKYKNYLFPLPIKPTADYKSGMCRFGGNRSGGKRKHAGADLYAPVGTTVRAMEQGVVLRAGSFYAGTYFVTIKHPNHIIRYGELQPGTLKVKAGDFVKIGQPIGYVGKLKGISVPSNMLHLEMYSNVNDHSKLTVRGSKGGIFQRRADLINPNSFLDKANK